MVEQVQTKICYRLGQKVNRVAPTCCAWRPSACCDANEMKWAPPLNQSQPHSFGHGLDAIRDLQLAKDVLNFALDR